MCIETINKYPISLLTILLNKFLVSNVSQTGKYLLTVGENIS